MKSRFALSVVILALLAVSVSSCRKHKASCAAYDQVPTGQAR